MNAELRFRFAIQGMHQAIRQAADPACPRFIPYKGYVWDLPTWWVREVVRQARGLGLLPTDGEPPVDVQVTVAPEPEHDAMVRR